MGLLNFLFETTTGVSVISESYLEGDALEENKELFDKLIQKWDEFLSNPNLMKDIEVETDRTCYLGKNNRGRSEEYSLYLCKYLYGEFRFAASALLSALYCDFTKDGTTLAFVAEPDIENHVYTLSLYLRPKGSKEISTQVQLVKSMAVISLYPSLKEMMKKLNLESFYEKMEKVVKHVYSIIEEEEKRRCQEEEEQRRSEMEQEKREKELARQRVLEEKEKRKQENLNMLDNLKL
ncbi:MAG: hypothetical protein ACTTJ6_03385 [Treponema sp.]